MYYLPTPQNEQWVTTAVAGATTSRPTHERVSIDITEMGSGAIGQKYVLTVIDNFSRFVNLYPMSTRTVESVVSKLNMVAEAYGAPRVLLADNAREFCSEKLKAWGRENGIRLVHCTPYHPQGNASVRGCTGL